MPVRKLKGHKSVGWDMDETLVNGPMSTRWREFVLENPEVAHWVVTFRSKEDAESLWDELEAQHLYPLSRDLFEGLMFMPDRVRVPYEALPNKLKEADVSVEPDAKTKRALELYKYEWDDVKNRHLALQRWKAEACNEVGATVLVDDLEHLVKEGCEFHGVEFVNSTGK